MTNLMVENIRTRQISEILTDKDDGTGGVRNIKYFGPVINSEIAEFKTRILADNKSHSCLHTTFRSKQIH
jgi:hypothetical protein